MRMLRELPGRIWGQSPRGQSPWGLSPILALLLFAPAKVPAIERASEAVPLSAFPTTSLTIETRSARRHVYTAWVADDDRLRWQGLMFVESMRDDQAMVFIYEPPQVVSMWMKNTLMSLDMLFVDEAGCVVTIKERATPGSLGSISSRYPVMVVVELKGGTVASLGLQLGNRISLPDAGWPPRGEKPLPCTVKSTIR
jgi:hypothetical protein